MFSAVSGLIAYVFCSGFSDSGGILVKSVFVGKNVTSGYIFGSEDETNLALGVSPRLFSRVGALGGGVERSTCVCGGPLLPLGGCLERVLTRRESCL